jgi:hypothetical protein
MLSHALHPRVFDGGARSNVHAIAGCAASGDQEPIAATERPHRRHPCLLVEHDEFSVSDTVVRSRVYECARRCDRHVVSVAARWRWHPTSLRGPSTRPSPQ